ncbi:17070_t:CDS:2, partial [Racocetra persica]
KDIWHDLSKKDNVKIQNIEVTETNNVISEKSMDSERKVDETNENSDNKKNVSLKRKDLENEQIIEIKDNNFDGNNGLEKDITNDDTSNILNIPFILQRKKSSDIEHSNITPCSVSPSSLSIQKKMSYSSKGSFDSNIVKKGSELPSTSKEVIISEPDDDVSSMFNAIKNKLPTVYSVFIRLPGNLLPFMLGMFILVEALSSLGWISIFANAMSTLTPTYPVAVISIAFISIILCNLLNNLPMTVLLSKILQDDNFAAAPHVTPAIRQGCIYSLIIGSNIGACLTIVGALAGLMWDKILKDKGEKIGYWQFVKWNLGVLPVIAVGALEIHRTKPKVKSRTESSTENQKLYRSKTEDISYAIQNA